MITGCIKRSKFSRTLKQAADLSSATKSDACLYGLPAAVTGHNPPGSEPHPLTQVGPYST